MFSSQASSKEICLKYGLELFLVSIIELSYPPLLILDRLDKLITKGNEYSPDALVYPDETPESISFIVGTGNI